MESRIIEFLSRPDYAPLNVPQLLEALALERGQQQELQGFLASLERSGQIARIKGNRYVRSLDADLVPGRIRINRQGKGFVQPDDSTIPEIAIPEHATATAFNSDRVLVRRDPTPVPQPGDRLVQPTGKVIRILESSRTQLVGTLQRSKQFLYVVPDDPRIPHDIYVLPARDVGREPNLGDKVVVELRSWESRHVNPEGEIIEVLGPPDQEGVDMLSVLRQYNLPLHFPKPVLEEAHAIGSEVQAVDLAGRTDCRAHQAVTIDPDDAKDFDDAICLEAAPNQQWKLWVHIADVSHYVKPGTALDEEAAKRGNSTYLVDRVIPMLPEALSNELCSLKPDVDRLTKCVEFLLSAEGAVLRTHFYPAIIRSKHRFSYKEALATLQRAPENPIGQMLHAANDVAQRIRRARFKAGSLELDFPENKIRLDEHGKVLRIERMENDISHQLIEEFMLLANEAVAARLMGLNRPSIYRIHEPPDARRLQEYRQDVLGHHIHCGNLDHRPEVQKLLQKLGTIAIGSALKIGFLRSLMRARYAVEPLGHYGLAKKKYTHFTSPIRRYADLVVHRTLFRADGQSIGMQPLKTIADHISETERNSADAERDSKDVKMFAYLEAQLKAGRPEIYPALVTDVRNFGFFVDVTGLGMSGAVPLSTMTDDFYQFDFNRSQVVGRRTRRVIKLGDKVTVQIAKVDRFKKQVDFKLAGQPVAQSRDSRFRDRESRAGSGFKSRTPGTDRRPGNRDQTPPTPRKQDRKAPVPQPARRPQPQRQLNTNQQRRAITPQGQRPRGQAPRRRSDDRHSPEQKPGQSTAIRPPQPTKPQFQTSVTQPPPSRQAAGRPTQFNASSNLRPQLRTSVRGGNQQRSRGGSERRGGAQRKGGGPAQQRKTGVIPPHSA